MNPLWFFVGVEIGDRIYDNAPALKRLVKRAVRQSVWTVQAELLKWRGANAYHSWLAALPVKGGDS